jgi:hypothetical protein
MQLAPCRTQRDRHDKTNGLRDLTQRFSTAETDGVPGVGSGMTNLADSGACRRNWCEDPSQRICNFLDGRWSTIRQD